MQMVFSTINNNGITLFLPSYAIFHHIFFFSTRFTGWEIKLKTNRGTRGREREKKKELIMLTKFKNDVELKMQK